MGFSVQVTSRSDSLISCSVWSQLSPFLLSWLVGPSPKDSLISTSDNFNNSRLEVPHLSSENGFYESPNATFVSECNICLQLCLSRWKFLIWDQEDGWYEAGLSKLTASGWMGALKRPKASSHSFNFYKRFTANSFFRRNLFCKYFHVNERGVFSLFKTRLRFDFTTFMAVTMTKKVL